MSNSNPECAGTRGEIDTAAFFINNITARLDIDDEGYEEQTESLSDNLAAARKAFAEKPASCQMVDRCDDTFECDDCNFYVDID